MTIEQKNEILGLVSELLDKLFTLEEAEKNIKAKPVIEHVSNEMLTIKECVEKFPGLTAHTIRKLVKRGVISSIRAGDGRNGKILIKKSSLVEFLES